MSSSSSDGNSSFATVKVLLSAVASAAATAVMVRGIAKELLPYEFNDYLLSGVRSLFRRFSKDLTLVICEFDGLVKNKVYEAAEAYLGSKVTSENSRLKLSMQEKAKHFDIAVDRGEQVVDLFRGETFRWKMVCSRTGPFANSQNDSRSPKKIEEKSFELTFNKKNRDLAIDVYLPHILNVAEDIKSQKKSLQIFTVSLDSDYCMEWVPATLDHPSTFDNLAMESDQRDMIMKDLHLFLERKEYYKKIGKAWKRGYLLYGPPGTGKSSLIAAMANYLNFDVYDLELSEVKENSDLRTLLLRTANKSILVVEDIDCTIDMQKKLANRTALPPEDLLYDHRSNSKVTLSGLLNFVDGLWSSCGSERIIIFTTNHVEKLDPALLRPGRMDWHIQMSYCKAGGFKVLAWNYLAIRKHPLFPEILDLIQNVNVTPAEVAEQLLKDGDPDIALQCLVEFIRRKKDDVASAKSSPATDSIDQQSSVQAQVKIRGHMIWSSMSRSALKPSQKVGFASRSISPASPSGSPNFRRS